MRNSRPSRPPLRPRAHRPVGALAAPLLAFQTLADLARPATRRRQRRPISDVARPVPAPLAASRLALARRATQAVGLVQRLGAERAVRLAEMPGVIPRASRLVYIVVLALAADTVSSMPEVNSGAVCREGSPSRPRKYAPTVPTRPEKGPPLPVAAPLRPVPHVIPCRRE